MDTVPLEAARLVLLLCGCFFCFWTASSSMAQDPRTEQQERSCVAVSFRDDSIVCACNGSYCDVVGVDPRPDHAHLLVYTSSQAGDRLLHRQIPLLPGPPTNSTKDVLFSFNPTTRYQRIKGFGGAVTDSAAINIKSLSPSAQKNLLRAYFAPEGIEYNIIRVPIASCDFSTRAYTYDDVPGDLQLKHFSLAMEDVKYKIPVLHEITSMASRPLSLFASPWTAPPWMKTNDNFTGNATIKGRPGGAYYKSWANYFVKFLDEYENRNVSFWAVTVQNEPTNAPFVSFQSTGFTPDLERDFILADLGPALQARRGRRVKIMAIDDQRLLLPLWPKVILSNPKAEQYVDGFALHWYLDDFVPAYLTLNTTHHLYPNIFLLATEACVGSFPGERAVQLGNWERGERYSHSIIQDFSYWVTGWTDWNLALDMKGGPNWAQNFVDSPIIVDSRKDTFYKQPMFYHLAHFSKFIPEGSQRVDLSSSSDSVLQVVAFMRGDDLAVIVILNRSSDPISFTLYDPKVGHARLTAASHSIQTLLWEHKNAWE